MTAVLAKGAHKSVEFLHQFYWLEGRCDVQDNPDDEEDYSEGARSAWSSTRIQTAPMQCEAHKVNR
jgi:hypothetical protein